MFQRMRDTLSPRSAEEQLQAVQADAAARPSVVPPLAIPLSEGEGGLMAETIFEDSASGSEEGSDKPVGNASNHNSGGAAGETDETDLPGVVKAGLKKEKEEQEQEQAEGVGGASP